MGSTSHTGSVGLLMGYLLMVGLFLQAQKSAGPGGIDAQCAVWQRSVRAADHASGCFDAKDSTCFRLWAY